MKPLCAFAAAALAALSVDPAGAEARTAGHVAFDVLREGRPFGRQSVTVSAAGDDMVAETGAELRYVLGPLTLFSYSQHCRENWRAGALVGLRCLTQQNGRRKAVNGAAASGAFRVANGAGAVQFPTEILPTSWWSKPPLETREMVNTETGERLAVRVSALGQEWIEAGGQRIRADHIRVVGTLPVDLWYDEAGHWVGCAFTLSGQHMTYRLTTPRAEAPS